MRQIILIMKEQQLMNFLKHLKQIKIIYNRLIKKLPMMFKMKTVIIGPKNFGPNGKPVETNNPSGNITSI